MLFLCPRIIQITLAGWRLAMAGFLCCSWMSDCHHVYGQSELMLRDICRLKGQEENVLQGQGLVVGLKGTGDGSLKPTMRALARSLQLMGGQIATDLQGRLVEKDIDQTKNVALVFVTATIPASGAQPGDKLPCTISAINAKSLEGGMLMMTPLVGPRADRPTVYALAQGPITLENPRIPTSGYITAGCKMEAEVRTEFMDQDTITLVLETSQSSFGMAQDIEDLINQFTSSGFDGSGSRANRSGSTQSTSTTANAREKSASAIDQSHIEVKIPSIYREHPVQFISELLKLRLVVGKNNRRVVIREREGVVAIGEDVMIAPVAISHKNLTISSKPSATGANGFIGVGYDKSSGGTENTTLNQLVKALNLLAIPNEDIIAIIKAIERQGNLYGELVLE